jgi:hypothetical protein
MKTIIKKFTIGLLAVALVGGIICVTATSIDAGSDKKTKTSTTGSSTRGGGGTKGVSSMDLGSGR